MLLLLLWVVVVAVAAPTFIQPVKTYRAPRIAASVLILTVVLVMVAGNHGGDENSDKCVF